MSGQAESRDGAPRLLSGGNPQIAKGHGDAPVQAWIKAAVERNQSKRSAKR